MKHLFSEGKQRFSIRKYSIGTASVLLSTLVFGSGIAQADQIDQQPKTTDISVVASSRNQPEIPLSAQEQSSSLQAESTLINSTESSNEEISVNSFNSDQDTALTLETTETTATALNDRPQSSSMPRRQGGAAEVRGTSFFAATESETSSETTFDKQGTEITVTNPDVHIEFPNGNLKDQGNRVVYDNIQFPDHIAINEGDRVTFSLPQELGIRTSYSFPVYNANNDQVGEAYADPSTGTITTTFNNYFQSYPTNKSMSLTLDTIWSDMVTPGGSYELDFDGRRIWGEVGNYGEIVGDEVIRKSGTQNRDDDGVLDWSVRFNYARRLLNNIQIIDSWSDNQRFVEGSLDIRDEHMNDVSYLISSFSHDDTNFYLNLAQLDKMIYIWYSTKLVDTVANSTNPINTMTAYADDERIASDRFEVELVGGQGSVSGDRSVATPINFGLDLKKALTGRPLKDQEFTFKLENVTNPANPVDMGTVTNTADGKIAFQNIQVDEEGTYKYRVTEVPGTEAEMVYDDLEAIITVEVTKTLDANNFAYLEANIVYPDDIEFNNTLATPAKASIEFTKALEGRELKDYEFEFQLIDENGTLVETVTNKNGKVNFSELEFAKVGTYTYTVKEVAGTDEDVIYDDMVAQVTITVAKDGSVLKSTVTNPADTEFNNKVKETTPAKAQFDFTKVLANRDLKAGEFSFTLKDEAGNVLETVTNDQDGKITFSELSYNAVGTYKYTVEEVAGTDVDITYDTMTAEVTVEVSKTVGATANALVSVKTLPADTEFNNTYNKPISANAKIAFTKALAGRNLIDGEFSFELKDTDGNLIETVTNKNGNVTFSELSYDQAGTYTYTVNEVKGADADIKYDDMVATVTVTVSKDGNAYVATVANPADTEFNNSVKETTPGKAQFEFTKVLAGRKLEAGEFSFELKDAAGNVIQTKTNDANGKVTFDDISYDTEGTFTYTVSEVKGSDEDVIYDTMVANVSVTVTKEVGETINTFVTATQLSADTEFNNELKEIKPGQAQFEFTKALEGRELKAGEFSFLLKDEQGNIIETVQNDAAGKVTFSKLTYDKAGTYNYTVEEVKGTDASVAYDTMVAKVSVLVRKEIGETVNTFVTAQTLPSDTEFNNKVTPPETPKFQPEKYVLSEEKYSITDNKLLDDDAELTDKYGDTNKDPYVDKTDNNEAENINTKTVNRGDKLVYQVWLDTTQFDANNKDNIQTVGITDDYDEAKLELDAANIKAYDSITGEDVTAKFDISVNNGVITANLKGDFTKSLGDAENTQVIDTTKFAFGRYYKFDIPTIVKATVAGGVDIENTAAQVVNYYNPVTKKVEKPEKPTEKRVNNVPVEVEFNFTKRLEGRELQANEFSFVLKDSEGNIVQTVSNDADGNVKFSPLSFKKGEEGVHNYTVEEVAGTDATVTYDTMKAAVTVTVSHDGTAKILVAKVSDIADTEFNNKVLPNPIKVEFEFTKVLEGRELKDKEFTFALFEKSTSGDDVFLGFAQNDANGKVVFDGIEYAEAGEHSYYVVEVIGNDTTVIYDRMSAEVKVTVTKDAATNTLSANISMPEDTEFNNKVTPPTPNTPPKPGVPPTTPPAPNTPPTPSVPPKTPEKPATPSTLTTESNSSTSSTLPKTGEEKARLTILFGMLMASAGLSMGYTGRRRKK